MAAHGRYWRLLRRQQLVESIEQEGEALAGALDTDTIVS
jgi:hypothetical protein